jgi:hypothetical protein
MKLAVINLAGIPGIGYAFYSYCGLYFVCHRVAITVTLMAMAARDMITIPH